MLKNGLSFWRKYSYEKKVTYNGGMRYELQKLYLLKRTRTPKGSGSEDNISINN